MAVGPSHASDVVSDGMVEELRMPLVPRYMTARVGAIVRATNDHWSGGTNSPLGQL